MAAWLRFAKWHVNKPQEFGNNELWTDDSHSTMFGDAYQHKDLTATVWHNNGGAMIWACYLATGPGHLTDFEYFYVKKKSILESNVRPSNWQLKLSLLCCLPTVTSDSFNTILYFSLPEWPSVLIFHCMALRRKNTQMERATGCPLRVSRNHS